MTKYYFTGTRSQLLEKVEGLDRAGRFVEGEKTFMIEVSDITEEPQVNEQEEADKLDNPAGPEDGKVEPATGSVDNKPDPVGQAPVPDDQQDPLAAKQAKVIKSPISDETKLVRPDTGTGESPEGQADSDATKPVKK